MIMTMFGRQQDTVRHYDASLLPIRSSVEAPEPEPGPPAAAEPPETDMSERREARRELIQRGLEPGFSLCLHA